MKYQRKEDAVWHDGARTSVRDARTRRFRIYWPHKLAPKFGTNSFRRLVYTINYKICLLNNYSIFVDFSWWRLNVTSNLQLWFHVSCHPWVEYELHRAPSSSPFPFLWINQSIQINYRLNKVHSTISLGSFIRSSTIYIFAKAGQLDFLFRSARVNLSRRCQEPVPR